MSWYRYPSTRILSGVRSVRGRNSKKVVDKKIQTLFSIDKLRVEIAATSHRCYSVSKATSEPST